MIKKIDCRKLDCPAPVLKTKKYIEHSNAAEVEVIVDNEAAVENVSRFLNFHGFEVTVDSDGEKSVVCGQKKPGETGKIEIDSNPVDLEEEAENQKILLMISSMQIGKGDDELGRNLMVNFVKTLKEMGSDLWRVVFVNHGVKFSVKDSRILEELRELEASGVDILVCGACLTHLGLLDEKLVGQTTNMLDIVTSMQLADKVINL